MSTDHITWKTNAWKDPAMVESYASRMRDTAGFSLMKNRIEPELFAKYAQGKSVLDVGIGTGRASLPLAVMGFDVTGVDSSEAMLRKSRDFAAELGTTMTLLQGDVAALEFRDSSFDTVIALNTIAHFPHWQQIMAEWARVTRPGGRLIFDLFSMDHDIAYARAVGRSEQWGVDHFEPPHVSEYYLRLKSTEFVASLDSMGLSVAAIVPYSVFFGIGGFNRFFEGTVVEGFSWNRLLSWIGRDQSLYDFFAFLEQGIVANLTPSAACRYMVVLDKTAAPEKNRAWIDWKLRYDEALSRGLTLETMAEFSTVDAAVLKTTLNAFMRHAPNRFALAQILFANLRWNWPVALESFLEPPFLDDVRGAYERARLDADLVAMLSALHQAPAVADAFRYKSVPVGPTIEYDAITEILEKAYNAFGEPA